MRYLRKCEFGRTLTQVSELIPLALFWVHSLTLLLILFLSKVPLRGTLDTPEFKAVWANMGPEALRHATAAKETFEEERKGGDVHDDGSGNISEGSLWLRLPLAEKSPVAAVRQYKLWPTAIYMDAWLFEGSSKGIVKQAIDGAGVIFLRLADEMIANMPTFDNAVGWAYRGAFFTVAPWPLRSLATAEKNMDTLLERAPDNRRNRYYRGVVAFRQERWAQAVNYFESALDVECVGHTQIDFCDFITAEAKRGIAEAKEKQDR